jgi:hypothetical protein
MTVGHNELPVQSKLKWTEFKCHKSYQAVDIMGEEGPELNL